MRRRLIRIAGLAVAGVFLFTSAGFSAASGVAPVQTNSIIVLQVDSPYMAVNGVKKEIDPGAGTSPVLHNNRTLVPVRSVVEALGGTVGWVPEDRKINVYYETHLIEMWVGRKEVFIDGTAKELDVEPITVKERTLLPLRFVAESLGCKVLWDENTGRITLFKNPGSAARSIAMQEKNSLGGLWLEGTGRLKTPVTDTETEIRIVIPNSPETPFKPFEDSAYLKNIHEKTGVKANVTEVSEERFSDKVKLMAAANDLPDILWEIGDFPQAARYTSYNIFLSYSQYLEHMPNLSDILYAEPELKGKYTAYDGNMYILPYLTEEVSSQALLVREDVFQAEKLKMPETYEEFYLILKYLQQKYPQSIPFAWQPEQAKGMYAVMADNWGTGFGGASGSGVYFNRESKKYQFGPTEANFRQMIEFLMKAYREGLMDREFAVMKTPQWEERVMSGKVLTTLASTSKVKTINDRFYSVGSEARMAAIIPLAAVNGRRVLPGSGKDVPGLGAVVNAKVKNPVVVCKFLDWFYSGEGALQASYGIPDVTYVKNNEGTISWKDFIKTEENPQGDKSLSADYGAGKGLKRYQFDDNLLRKKAKPELYDNRLQYSLKLLKDSKSILEPEPVLAFTPEELQKAGLVEGNVRTFVEESMIKFIMGVKPISEWDAYVVQAKKLGVDEIVKLYNEAYEKQKSKYW